MHGLAPTTHAPQKLLLGLLNRQAAREQHISIKRTPLFNDQLVQCMPQGWDPYSKNQLRCTLHPETWSPSTDPSIPRAPTHDAPLLRNISPKAMAAARVAVKLRVTKKGCRYVFRRSRLDRQRICDNIHMARVFWGEMKGGGAAVRVLVKGGEWGQEVPRTLPQQIVSQRGV
jgi:hypothetical protein